MMSVRGFASVLKDCVDVVVDGSFSFKIPSAPAFFVLKFDAWLDRHNLNDKDAQDMSFILSNYYLHDVMQQHGLWRRNTGTHERRHLCGLHRWNLSDEEYKRTGVQDESIGY